MRRWRGRVLVSDSGVRGGELHDRPAHGPRQLPTPEDARMVSVALNSRQRRGARTEGDGIGGHAAHQGGELGGDLPVVNTAPQRYHRRHAATPPIKPAALAVLWAFPLERVQPLIDLAERRGARERCATKRHAEEQQRVDGERRFNAWACCLRAQRLKCGDAAHGMRHREARRRHTLLSPIATLEHGQCTLNRTRILKQHRAIKATQPLVHVQRVHVHDLPLRSRSTQRLDTDAARLLVTSTMPRYKEEDEVARTRDCRVRCIQVAVEGRLSSGQHGLELWP